MKRLQLPRAPDPQLLLARLEELRLNLRSRDPDELARYTGASFHPDGRGGGEFILPVWDQPMRITFPQLAIGEMNTAREPGAAIQALILYYLHTCDGAPPGERFIAFSELPEGKFYTQAFQGYTGKELAKHFGDRQAFEQAATQLGGIRYPHGESSYVFNLFPRVRLLAVYWQGDEDFPSNCQILFSEKVNHHLPTDACAIVGSILSRRLLAVR